MDMLGKPWRTNHEQERFCYTDEHGTQKTYAPDFWWDGKYVEVKGHLDQKAAEKIKQVISQGVELLVVRWHDLKQMETDLFGKPLAGANTPPSVIKRLGAQLICKP